MTRRGLSVGSISVAVAGLLAAGSARAAPLLVTDDAQPGMVSTVPQSPLAPPVRGTCATVRAASEATDPSTSSCPAGTWPAQASSDWFAQALHVAGGDTVRLTFDAPTTAVQATGTTAQPSIQRPVCPGPPVARRRILCPLSASPRYVIAPNESLGDLHPTATANPAVWTLALPTLDDRERAGVELAVVATSAAGSRDFALGLTNPRARDESAQCKAGNVGYVNPGVTVRTACAKAPTQRVPVATGRVPRIVGKPRLRGRRLRVTVAANASGRVRIGVALGARTLAARRVAVTTAAHTFTLHLGPKGRRRLTANREAVVTVRYVDARSGDATARANVSGSR